MPPSLYVLPRPRAAKTSPGKFAISRSTPIVLSASCSHEDYFAATLLRDELAIRSSIELPIEKHARGSGLGRHILLARLEDTSGKGAAFESVRGALPADRIGPEGYVIEVTSQRAAVAASGPAGIYYGVQTLRQILDAKAGRASLPCVRITDWPLFRYRGVMLDISRCKVPTNETLRKLVELLGSLKVNVLQLYTEHTFAFRRHEAIGRGVSPLTAEDVLSLDEFAAKHHVELQANLQSFGHMSHILGLEEYKHLAESEQGWTIAPMQPETYQFLDELYAEYLCCFKSKLFNADCDETWDLGKGKSRKLCEKLGLGRVYLEHIKKLRALAAKYGKRLMIWGDIVLQHPEVIKDIPRDVIMLNWGYSADHDFASTRKFAKAGLEHWVCPGTNSWSSLFPRIEVACQNIARFAQEGVRTKATGLLNTDWGDGGHPNMLGTSFHGFAFGAEASWSGPAKDADDFDMRFSWALARNRSGTLGKIFRALGQTNAAFGRFNYTSVPFELYWAEFPYGEALAKVDTAQLSDCERWARSARALIASARQIIPEEKLLLDELDFAARQTLLACAKARTAKAILKISPRPDSGPGAGFGGKGLPPSLVAEVAELHREWRIQRDEFERLWMARSRRSEIEYRLRLYRDREQELARLAAPALGQG